MTPNPRTTAPLRRTLPAWIVAVLIAIASAAPIALATSYPIEVRDELGHEVRLEAAPVRIVSMIPGHTELVCALGACDRLVGVDAFSNHPSDVEELPDLGSAFTPNLEALVALEPDLVLVDVSTELPASLARLDLPVYATTAESLDEIFDLIGRLGTLLDREAAAERLQSDLAERIEAVAERVADRPRPSVYYELDATPYSVGPGSFVHGLLVAAGAANIVPDDLGAFPQLDPEFVVAADPEVIVLADAPYGESEASLRARPGWDTIDALVSGRVIELTADQVDLLNRPGPRVADAVELLARLVHPDAF